MSRLENLSVLWGEARAFGRIAKKARWFRPSGHWNAAELVDLRAKENPRGLALTYLERRYSWSEFNGQANRYAQAFQELGVGEGEVVVLLMDNRPEFLFALTALCRIGAVAALINTHITGKALVHAIRVAKPVCGIIGSEHAAKVSEVLADLSENGKPDLLVQCDEGDAQPAGFDSFDHLLAEQNAARPIALPRTRADGPMCYIYTSGTTGLPKAAIVTHLRWLTAGAMFGAGLLDLGPKDVIYLVLPLYHSSAMFAGWGASLTTGAAIALRRKFSASNFWSDVCHYEATAFVYIGELCRYLLNQPETPQEKQHKVRVITGNGLRPDIWERFQQRCGIPLIREFYGATEGNAPLINVSGRPGMVGRLMPGQAIVRCDAESGALLRNAEGFCERVATGETGLLLGRISGTMTFTGYVDPTATSKKVLTDIFEKGDRYFDTGDLLTLHPDRWVSFADRIGDTFRWKGENVSTNEVAEILNGAPGVLESNVYGVQVPGHEGRAGMASLNVDENFSIEAFNAFVLERLPVFQRPYFVRLQKDMRITGTFKHQKVDYREEAYDPSRVPDPLYFLDDERYVPLDAALFAQLHEGRLRLR